MRRLPVSFAGFVCALVLFALAARADPPTAAQRERIAEAGKLKAQVSRQIRLRRYADARGSLAELEEAIQKLKAEGVHAKDPLIVPLDKFVEAQKKRLAREEPSEAAPKDAAAPAPAGGDGVSYVQEIAPIFARNCQGCHGATNPRSKFNLTTFQSMMRGGERGDDIVPGKPDESLLVLLLQGKEEPRMPRGGRRLRDDLIEKVETWVKQGARFDGAPRFTPDTPLAQMVPSEEDLLRAKVAAMSDTELAELHRTLAVEHWQTANPAKQPGTAETDHFILYGTLPPAELEQAGQWAEAALRDLARMFARPAREPLWKGKLTIHLFGERREYLEHAMMVEHRELPPEVNGHQFSTIETSYVALHKPADSGDASLRAYLVELVAQAYLAVLGETPRWFNIGVGRYLAARIDPRAELYREHRQGVRDAVTGSADPLAAIMDGSAGPDADLLGFGLVDFLLAQRQGEKGIAALATQLRQKTPPDKAIQSVYGTDRKTLAGAWSAFAAKRYPVARKR